MDAALALPVSGKVNRAGGNDGGGGEVDLFRRGGKNGGGLPGKENAGLAAGAFEVAANEAEELIRGDGRGGEGGGVDAPWRVMAGAAATVSQTGTSMAWRAAAPPRMVTRPGRSHGRDHRGGRGW